MKNPVIVDAIRSPMARAKPDGALAQLHPVDLLSQVLQQLVERNKIDPGSVDDVICGCVSQSGEQANTPGRLAWLAAGLPMHVPSTTIDRKCGSSQQAVHFAAQAIMAGVQDIVIACGVESMSRVPMGSSRMGKNTTGARFDALYAPGLVGQGVSADLVAAKWGLGRTELDAYAARSHQRAHAAQAGGGFAREIVGMDTPAGRVAQDETIRAGTTVEKLAGLKAVFETEELSARFPQIQWNTTAGNASQMTDGAAAMLIMSEERALQLGLTPRARFVAFDVVGDDPLYMLTAPIPATQRVLAKARMKLDDIHHYEINEAFASVPMAWQKELKADGERLNPRGGAIALGHPLGATGAIRAATVVHALRRHKLKYGMVTMCVGTGQGAAGIFERV